MLAQVPAVTQLGECRFKETQSHEPSSWRMLRYGNIGRGQPKPKAQDPALAPGFALGPNLA